MKGPVGVPARMEGDRCPWSSAEPSVHVCGLACMAGVAERLQVGRVVGAWAVAACAVLVVRVGARLSALSWLVHVSAPGVGAFAGWVFGEVGGAELLPASG